MSKEYNTYILKALEDSSVATILKKEMFCQSLDWYHPDRDRFILTMLK